MSIIKTDAYSDRDLEALPIVGEQPKDEKERKHLNEILKYEFMNLEEPGMFLKFPYGSTKRKVNFTLQHGGKYRLPRHVARHLGNCSKPIWDWRPDGSGKMTKQRIGDKPRFQLREVYEG
jgi:hypothetical protein